MMFRALVCQSMQVFFKEGTQTGPLLLFSFGVFRSHSFA